MTERGAVVEVHVTGHKNHRYRICNLLINRSIITKTQPNHSPKPNPTTTNGKWTISAKYHSHTLT